MSHKIGSVTEAEQVKDQGSAFEEDQMEQVWAAELGLRWIGNMGQMELRVGDG
jgi:hypothetical protein